MKEYILLRKGKNTFWSNLNQDDHTKIMEEFSSFVSSLDHQGILKEGYSLKHDGVQMRMDNQKIVTDGPFSEAKEAMLGYVVFEAENLEKAKIIAQGCPALKYGEYLEMYERQ